MTDTKPIDFTGPHGGVEEAVRIVGELARLAVALESEGGPPEAIGQLREAATHVSRAAVYLLPAGKPPGT